MSRCFAPLLVGAALASNAALAGGFSLRLPGLKPGARVPLTEVWNRDGCEGGNRSPALRWQHPPAGTRSFAVTVFDPDAPGGQGWWHWLLWNLPPTTRSLQAGRLPLGAAQADNSYGDPGYGGPCPPPGPAHRYVYTVYALDASQLDVPQDARPAQAAAAIRRHALAEARLTLRYGR